MNKKQRSCVQQQTTYNGYDLWRSSAGSIFAPTEFGWKENHNTYLWVTFDHYFLM